ncbi:MAG: sigma 54-interacting transcriptional regulator [Desulfovibrio sp.]|nr:sigma 54-interacting transcriptional regulator [Desulfovibrio sp.]
MIAEWREQGVRLEVMQAIGARAVSRLRIKPDAAICRGVTGVALSRTLAPEIPLIELKTTGYDVMRAIHLCRSNPDNPRPYTVIGTKNMVHGLQKIIDILGLELEFHVIGSEDEAITCFEERMRQGRRTIIGGATIVGVAERRGVPAVLIRSCEESLRQAIEEAVLVAGAALQTRTAMEQTRISLNSLAEGIIMLDTNGVVTQCNTSAVRLMRGPKGKERDLVGKKASALLPQFDATRALSGQEDFVLTLLEGKHAVAASCFPVLVNGVSRGAVATLQEISRVQEMEGTIRSSLHSKGHIARYTFEQCLGSSRVFTQMLDKAKIYSRTQAGVLLYGETGTGKEIVAQSMHNASPRRKGPFVAVNCAAFPETLLESMLFGYVEGAFTGASKEGKPGFFELAHGGTLFLDEVSEIPLCLQGRLLRVLQEHEVMRLGHDRVIPVDVRVIAASNRPLAPLTGRGLFRGDLFYRLNVLGLTLPPLRERGRDVEILARHFLDQFGRRYGHCSVWSEEALQLLGKQDWPGNVRELRNLCERTSVLSAAQSVGCAEARDAFDTEERFFPARFGPTSAGDDPGVTDLEDGKTIREITRQAAREALTAAGGNKGLAACRLGISRTTLWRILREKGAAQTSASFHNRVPPAD